MRVLNPKNRKNLAISAEEIKKVEEVGKIIAYPCSPKSL